MTSAASPLSVAVLAGGRSTRFRGEKALSRIDGIPLFERMLRTFDPLTDDLILQMRNDQAGLLAAVSGLGLQGLVPTISYDAVEGAGPLGGIVGALGVAKHDHVLALAVDLPELDGRISDALADLATCEADIVVPAWSDGKMEPLCAVYSRRVREDLMEIIEKEGECNDGDGTGGRNRMLGLQRTIGCLEEKGRNVVRMGCEGFLEREGLTEGYFRNVNVPEGGTND